MREPLKLVAKKLPPRIGWEWCHDGDWASPRMLISDGDTMLFLVGDNEDSNHVQIDYDDAAGAQQFEDYDLRKTTPDAVAARIAEILSIVEDG